MSLSGEINIPALSLCEENNGIIYYQDKPICCIRSENAHQYFTTDEDGRGELRGRLIKKILNKLKKRDSLYQSRWDRVWDDDICQKYKRKDYADYWLWDHSFYIADIEDLEYICALLKEV